MFEKKKRLTIRAVHLDAIKPSTDRVLRSNRILFDVCLDFILCQGLGDVGGFGTFDRDIRGGDDHVTVFLKDVWFGSAT